MPRRVKRSRNALTVLALALGLIAGLLTLRWKSRAAALGIGLEVQAVLFEAQLQTGGAPLKPIIEVFDNAKVREHRRLLNASWNFVAPDYRECVDELQVGMTYLQARLSRPGDPSLAKPPRLTHFKVATEGVDGRQAIRTLMDDYLGVIGSR